MDMEQDPVPGHDTPRQRIRHIRLADGSAKAASEPSAAGRAVLELG